MKKVLIFGAGGFVGRYLAVELHSHGYTVFGSDLRSAVLPNAEFYEADLMNLETVSMLVQRLQPDLIINLAAISSVSTSWAMPQTTMAVNVIGSLNLLDAVRTCQTLPKIMFIGSSEEYLESDHPINEQTPLNANNPYGISKMAQERFAALYRQRYGMQIYCVRPFNHTGIGQKESFVLPSFCKQAADIEKSGRPGVIRVGNLAAERDFSDVRDVVHAYRLILESGDCSKIYNVGSGQTHSLQDLLRYSLSLSTQPIKIEIDPARFRPVDTPRICCDNRLIRQELGWSPKYSIFDTLKEMFDFYKTH